jgi:predicted NAD/FAD-dependent oxidoreductase
MRVIVVGAGLAGLVAAQELHAAGVEVTVLDKGRSPGGRLATRRVGGATLDHGAQFFTVRTPAFAARVDDWVRRGLVHVWNHGFDEDDSHPRYVATAGMSSLGKDLAAGLDVRCSTMVFSVKCAAEPRPATSRVTVAIDDGTAYEADAVIITCPLPQAFALLVDSGVSLDETLFRTEYDRTIGLLARLDTPPDLPVSGGVQDADEVFGFIGDNGSKGVSAEPAVTFHANPTWSDEHWDDDNDELVAQLSTAARPWLGGARMLETSLKKWRLATPRSIWPDPCWTAADGTVVMAGDAFAGPKVEGAHNSGLAAAHSLLH